MENVKLISISQPRIENIKTAEELIAYVARVSNPKNQDNTATASKLLKYLITNNHWSPFEIIHLVFEINCSRSIGRQILRHRSFSFQEFSQRYAEVTPEMFSLVEARMQDPKNRQNSIALNSEEYGTDTTIADAWEQIQQETIDECIYQYNRALQLGIAKEQARVVLPEGLTKSKMYMAGSLRSWIHYCVLRSGNGTQKEHQQIAKECWNIIMQEFPSLKELFLQLTTEVNTMNTYSTVVNQ